MKLGEEKEVLNVMRAFKIDELSGVDHPMQEGAVAVLMKRYDGDDEEEDDPDLDTPKDKKTSKAMRLTSSEDGHSHLIEDDLAEGGHTSWEKAGSDKEYGGHSHPWQRNSDGSLTIGDADGHSHTALAQKVSVDKHAFDKEQQRLQKNARTNKAKRDGGSDVDANEKVTKLEAELERARVYGELNDAEKAAFKALSKSEQDEFLKSGPAGRAEFAKKAEELNPVVYKSDDGTEFRKSDDERLIKMARERDEDRKRMSEALTKAESADLEKRASKTLGHFGGDLKARTALLKAVDGIEDEEVRKSVSEALAGADSLLAKAQETLGTSTAPGAGADSPLAKLEKMARDRATEKGEQYEVAYSKVLETPEGRELYGEHKKQRAA